MGEGSNAEGLMRGRGCCGEVNAQCAWHVVLPGLSFSGMCGERAPGCGGATLPGGRHWSHGHARERIPTPCVHLC